MKKLFLGVALGVGAACAVTVPMIVSLRKKNKILADGNNELWTKLQDSEQLVNELNSQLTDAEDDLGDLEAEMINAKKDHKEQIASFEKQVKEQYEQLAGLYGRVSDLETEREELISVNEKLQQTEYANEEQEEDPVIHMSIWDKDSPARQLPVTIEKEKFNNMDDPLYIDEWQEAETYIWFKDGTFSDPDGNVLEDPEELFGEPELWSLKHNYEFTFCDFELPEVYIRNYPKRHDYCLQIGWEFTYDEWFKEGKGLKEPTPEMEQEANMDGYTYYDDPGYTDESIAYSDEPIEIDEDEFGVPPTDDYEEYWHARYYNWYGDGLISDEDGNLLKNPLGLFGETMYNRIRMDLGSEYDDPNNNTIFIRNYQKQCDCAITFCLDENYRDIFKEEIYDAPSNQKFYKNKENK